MTLSSFLPKAHHDSQDRSRQPAVRFNQQIREDPDLSKKLKKIRPLAESGRKF